MGTLIGFSCPKWKIFELKIYRRVICNENENDAKIEEELTSQFKIGMSNLTNFDSSTQKSRKLAI